MVNADVLVSYKDLSGAQRRFIAQKKINAAKTAEEWLAWLGPLAAFDELGDARRKRVGKWLGWSVVFLILGTIAAVILLMSGLVRWSGGVMGSVIVFWIIQLFRHKRLKSKDVGNELRDFVLPLMKLMRDDIGELEPVSLTLDLSGLTKEKAGRRERQSKRYPKTDTTYYTDPWFSLDARLRDKTRLNCEIIDQVRHKKVKKKNPRGKIKTKTKLKTKRIIRGVLGFPTARYALDTGAGVSGVKQSVKNGERRAALRVQSEDRFAGEKVVAVSQVLNLIGAAMRQGVPKS